MIGSKPELLHGSFAMVKDPQRHRSAAFVPVRRGQDRWWWVLTAGLVAGLLLYLFRHF
jgi:hypothetical protein